MNSGRTNKFRGIDSPKVIFPVIGLLALLFSKQSFFATFYKTSISFFISVKPRVFK